MLLKPFSIHPRTQKNGKSVYYAQFRLPNGKWSTAKSTRETSRARAEAWAIQYLNKGKIIRREEVAFEEYSRDFFSWEGKWALNKRSLGKRLSQRHCRERADLLKNHLLPRFQSIRLTAINEAMVDDLRIQLFKKGYSGSTQNKILLTLGTILKAAHKEALIQQVPPIQLVEVNEKRRGKLTVEEARRLFSIPWDDHRAFVACLIAATSGARLSEIQALRIKDIDFLRGKVSICRVWDYRIRIIKETTKSGKVREAPLPLQVLNEIQKLIDSAPRTENEELLFYSRVKGKPCEANVFMKSFFKALLCIGISNSLRRGRCISFHSFRYLTNSVLVDAGVATVKIHEAIGHTEDRLTERYFRSDDQNDIRQAIENALFDTHTNKIAEGGTESTRQSYQ